MYLEWYAVFLHILPLTTERMYVIIKEKRTHVLKWMRNMKNIYDYIFENENARLLVIPILHKICLPRGEYISERYALKLYWMLSDERESA